MSTSHIEQLYQATTEYVNCAFHKRPQKAETVESLRRLLAVKYDDDTECNQFTNPQVQELFEEQDRMSDAMNDVAFEDFVLYKLRFLTTADLERYVRLSYASHTYMRLLVEQGGTSALVHMMMALDANVHVGNTEAVDDQFIGTMNHFRHMMMRINDGLFLNRVEVFLVLEYMCAKKLKMLHRLEKIPLQSILIHTYDKKRGREGVSWANVVTANPKVKEPAPSHSAPQPAKWSDNISVRVVGKKESQSERKKRMCTK